MTQLKRTLRMADGLAVVVGIMIGSGIFRTPGPVATTLGTPALTFVAWALGGALGFLGSLFFAELATRHPLAGGKYAYAREAWGPRAAFTVGWVEALGTYCAAIAAIGTVCGEYLARLLDRTTLARPLGLVLIAAFTLLNLLGVKTGRLAQNVASAAKVLALLAVIAVAIGSGTGEGWKGSLPNAPHGLAALGALAVAFQAVIWTYYGYPDAAKIAEEVREPSRTLPRIFLTGIGTVTLLYLLLNAAYLNVLPFTKIASSNLVAADAVTAIFGAKAGVLMSALALLVVLGCLNANVFVTPRVVFGLSRDGLGPRLLSRVSEGGTPWTATLLVGAVALGLAASGTFERLLALSITFVLVIDGSMVLVLFRLRKRDPRAPFETPFYPLVPLAFLAVYALLLAGAAWQQPGVTAVAALVLAVTWALGAIAARYSATA